MREKPILFSGPMVKAILDGKKTQTRRVIKQADMNIGIPKVYRDRVVSADGVEYQPLWATAIHPARDSGWIAWYPGDPGADFTEHQYGQGFLCPYGAPGDRLWVRETWCEADGDPAHDARIHEDLDEVGYRCTAFRADDWIDCPADDGRWRPAIHMPRYRCRLLLDVLSIRVERLQDISEADAQAEGAELTGDDEAQDGAPDAPRAESYRAGFASLWDVINAERGHSWASNPYVWVITFRKIDK